ncbi:hypothetical protein EPL05_21230 [Mucilaginibacter gilvus]|uniref:Glycosyl hydrolases family 39 N-terminal catalytic domain-containing protein n=2 Tax=Mucilaginibacter gilvus TaxID=2305909 RepID=A0A444MJ00_9SPHI|nr:hypothetical protein EPL05_21230 [Mucilaginibacter gilvus]
MKARKRFVIISLGLPLILFSNLFYCIYPKAAQPQNITISVDCSKPRISPQKSMIGFLLSVNAQKPTSDLIQPLQPKYWRISSRNKKMMARMKAFGAKPIFLVSDVFKYAGPDNDFKKTPVLLMRQWKDTVRSVMFQYKAERIKPIYDIWNEPNGKQFWSGSDEEFFSTYKNGYDQIRSMAGGSTAMVSGPSISKFDVAFLGKFLDYCLANKMTLDVLSWHEFKSEDDIPKVADDILLAKSMFVNNPKYAALHIKSVQINEIIPQSDQFSPGSILAYFVYLEKGGADGACKACWTESNGKSNCFNNSLDGLIDAETMQPRAAWWAYKYYNLSLTNRLKYRSNNSHVVCFANYQTDKIQVLLGYYGDKRKNVSVTNVNLSLNSINSLASFAGKSSVNISVLSIPNTGEDVMDAPKATYQTTAIITNGQINFSVPEVYLSGACVVNIN